MSGRYWDGCRAAPVRLIGWTCAKKAFGLAFAAHIPDERLAALARLCTCSTHVPYTLLRGRKRPSSRRAAEKDDEITTCYHSITSSARASSVEGTVRPSALAVLRLMTRSNLVGCSTGISDGFVPRRTLSTNSAARRKRSGTFGP